MRLISVAFAIGLLVSACGRTEGQQALDGQVPRLPDGKPNLSGIWRSVNDAYRKNLAADGIEVLFQPSAATLFKERQGGKGSGNPSERCLPRGVPGAMLVRDYPWQVVQTPRAVLVLFDESLHYRQIFTDGRGFPEDPTPTWFGYSIGKWDGDALVAETTGFNEETWLDETGHPHSEALHVTERFRRRSVGAMDVDITIDDTRTYAKPWTATVRFELVPDTELAEHVCAVGTVP